MPKRLAPAPRTTSPSEQRSARHGRRLTASEKAAIVAAYEAGRAYVEIQDRFGVGHNTVARLTAHCQRRTRKLTDGEEQEVVSAYIAGATYLDLVRELHVSKGLIKAVLDKHEVSPRPGGSRGRNGSLFRMRRLSSQIASGYQTGASQTALAKRFELPKPVIAQALDLEGIERRPAYLAHARKYAVNHEAFAEVTPEGAYWIGFLMADGCVHGYSVQVTSHVRDRDHLRRFLDFVGSSNCPVRERDNLAIASVSSPRIAADLVRYGLIPRKSYGTRVWPMLATMPSFWLGVIDGDGTIGVSRAPYIRLCGSLPLLTQYQAFLAKAALKGRRQRIFRRADGLCLVTVEGDSARRVAELLYEGSPIALPRKVEKAKAVLRYRSSRTPSPDFSMDPRVRRRQRREIWYGTNPRSGHVAQIRSSLQGRIFASHGISDAHPWKPSPRSSMVAYTAVVDRVDAVVWVTARPDASVPSSIQSFAGSRPVYVLHVSPLDQRYSFLKRLDEKGSSKVPLDYLRFMRNGGDD